MARTAPVPNIPAIPGMNPGVFILGGGGSGGGRGGRGGNGAGGDQGAGGKNGGNGAQGGGRNAGSCGQGSGGGCPNPAHGGAGGTQAGHPMDPVTGRVYTVAVTDMALPGAFPLVIERAYSSAQRDRDYGLGHGWNHSLGWRVIELRRRRVRVITETALAWGQQPEVIPASPPRGGPPLNFRPAGAGSPLDRTPQQAAQGNTAALDDARRANATRYQQQLEADRAAGRNNLSDAEIQRRSNRVAGMTPGVFGGTGENNDWGPT
ncbi:DUF6531 domain-containing protein [Sorangium sp. So ce406]|uniref:DUF6531 domain-containing protein n=1 Tax=Sorangium sp. So ce406 TaxID=3133311 RepID=UPI003F5AED93